MFNNLTLGGGTNSAVTLSVTAGDRYFIQIDGSSVAKGDYILTIDYITNTYNDNFPGLNLGDAYEYDSLYIATSSGTGETSEPLFNGTTETIWHDYTPRENGTVTITSDDPAANDRIEAYTGTLGALSLVGQNTDALTFNVTAGITYRIGIDSSTFPASDSVVSLVHSAAGAQATNNDDFANAFTMSAQDFSTHFDNTGIFC